MNHAKSAGLTALLIVRDRHEEPCYLAIGAVRVGATVSPSMAPLPLLKIDVGG
jgi:hypothetical protein